MPRLPLLALFCCALLAGPALAQNTREDKVRNDKKKVEAQGFWIYNDLPKAFAEAKKENKPILVVLRCIPCVECVKLDDDLIDADKQLKPLLEKFVRARVVSTNGLDLSTFQFDTDQSFAAFMLNADGTIYGRFGTRSHRKEWVGDVSVEGLARALEGALELHKAYPKNKESLAGKRGPKPEYASPEKFPALKDRYKSTIDYQGKVVPSCIHCHQVGEAIRDVVMRKKEKLSDSILFPYPHPKILGLVLDPKERATVLKVEAKSDAASAGFEAGDVIRTLAGQPLLSIADVQWVLHRTSPDGGKVKAEIIRDGKPVSLTLELSKAWRQRDNISWRASTWALRRKALGGMLLAPLKDEDRKKWKLADDAMALSVEFVSANAPYDWAHKAGFRKGDVLVGFGDRTDLLRETDVIANSLRAHKPGDKVEVPILRAGKKQTLTLTLPE